MKDTNFNTQAKKPRVLVAPLDWGLGHATRCIPIIFKLLQENCDVIIAAEGAGKILLQKEFPHLDCIELKGYGIQYGRNRFLMPLKLILQFPKLVYSIFTENRWLKHVVAAYKIDAVISDNRLGLSHKKISSVYITHQLKIKTGNIFTDRIAQKIHYHFINKYRNCWVPDAKGEVNLTGELSHPVIFPKTPVSYIGPLSRFEKINIENKYDLCIILSGPEPQRTIFENIILNDLNNVPGKKILLRGLPGKNLPDPISNPLIEIKCHLPGAEMNMVIQQSKLIISRCGYSTVMDLVKLQKKAILVPTPGQTEQEYLATYLQQQQLFYCVMQNKFSLADALKKEKEYNYKELRVDQIEYAKVIDDFVKELQINSEDI